MFEIALNKCTVLLSTTGLEGNIPTIEALIWAQRAVPQQPAPDSSPCSPALSPVSQHPLLDEGHAHAALAHKVRRCTHSLLICMINYES